MPRVQEPRPSDSLQFSKDNSPACNIRRYTVLECVVGWAAYCGVDERAQCTKEEGEIPPLFWSPSLGYLGWGRKSTTSTTRATTGDGTLVWGLQRCLQAGHSPRAGWCVLMSQHPCCSRPPIPAPPLPPPTYTHTWLLVKFTNHPLEWNIEIQELDLKKIRFLKHLVLKILWAERPQIGMWHIAEK